MSLSFLKSHLNLSTGLRFSRPVFYPKGNSDIYILILNKPYIAPYIDAKEIWQQHHYDVKDLSGIIFEQKLS